MANKDNKGTKGGVLLSALGLNWGYGTSGPLMFVFAWGIHPTLSWMMWDSNSSVYPQGSADTYKDWYNYNKKGCLDSKSFIRYVQY